MESMMDAVEVIPVFDPWREIMRDYFDNAATFLINRDEPAAGRTPLESA
jgi:hypothetical protein